MAKKSSKMKRANTSRNGLVTCSLHCCDQASAPLFSLWKSERNQRPGFAPVGHDSVAEFDAETAATRYLQQAFEQQRNMPVALPVVDGVASEFKSIGTETIPLAGTTNVRFRQYVHKIPVYGSLITVELDRANELISISFSVGHPEGVDPVAKVSPAAALEAVRHLPGFDKALHQTVPRLHFVFDMAAQKWRLAYICEDVPVIPTTSPPKSPFRMDYMIDAHTGQVVAELPRTPTMTAETDSGVDGLGIARQFQVELSNNRKVLRNPVLNVQTFDFRFKDPETQEDELPGSPIKSPPAFSPSAVSAHANAEVVSQFMRTVLLRNNIDNAGGAMLSTINCVVQRDSPDGKQWINAFWNGNQMVYGQRLVDKSFRSMSVALEVVGHEMFHGVTDKSARLEYAAQTGALNESYSDIFGVIIANADQPDPRAWTWQIGGGLTPDNRPFRDMSNPTRQGQPDHMRNYQEFPNTEKGDYGGVHTNSGIHNKAAYNLLTAVDGDGRLVFEPAQVAALFYLTLTQQLSRTSQFSDSRRGVLTTARTLFRSAPTAQLDQFVEAIKTAFNAVGIK